MTQNHLFSERQRRINEIVEISREPAIDAWKHFEANIDEDNIANSLGYPQRYLYKLIANEFIHRLDSGTNFKEFPKFSKSLEDFCWNALCDEFKPNLHEKIARPSCIQLRQKLSLLYQENSDITKISKKSSRALLKKLSEKFNLSRDQIKTLIMIAMAEEGLRLEQIARQFNLSRERVRQIISSFGVSPIAIRQNAKKIFDSEKEKKQAELSNLIEPWINTHPGCYLSEITSTLGVTENVVLLTCPNLVKKLVLDGKRRKILKNSKYTPEQILESIRQAYDLRNPSMTMYSAEETWPLTGLFYEKLRNSGAVSGPSLQRIHQIFGTWKEACEKAEVPSGEALKVNYALRWSDDELIEHLVEFITTNEPTSVEKYDEWSRVYENRPSNGTLRNQLGPWTEAYNLALLHMRKQWTKE